MIQYVLFAVGVQQIEQLRATTHSTLGDEDMKGAVEAIVRLQHTYAIDEQSVANGHMTQPASTGTSPRLTTLDCYLLGLHQAQLGFHDYASRWLNVALARHEEDEREQRAPFIDKANILDWLQHSTYHRGNVSQALAISERIRQMDPGFANVDANIDFYRQVITEMSPETVEAITKAEERRPKLAGDGKYESLCRGEGKLVRMLLTYRVFEWLVDWLIDYSYFCSKSFLFPFNSGWFCLQSPFST